MLKVAALIDLVRSPGSGGHVKGWERVAAAAARAALPLDLTVYFSGAEKTEELSQNVRIRQLPQIFSTAKLKFLPYIPDHTDLAPYHPALARELEDRDVIHTTDAFFAFARTAERVAARRGVPLTHSFHTDQPAYARIFMAKAIEGILGRGALSRMVIEGWRLPARKQAAMQRRFARHLRLCSHALASRPIDLASGAEILGQSRIHKLRLGIDKTVFNPQRRDRAATEARFGVRPGHVIVVFVGRMDEGKNIYTLIDAVERCVAGGLPLHLVTAGVGPAEAEVRRRLPHNATVAGFLPPAELAALYASADLLAHPSEVEIRSMATIEALSCGLPALVAEANGVAQMFPPSPALRAIAGGADAWAAALRELATLMQGEGAQDLRRATETCAQGMIVGWDTVLREDFYPLWQLAAGTAQTKRAA
ncbi:MAG: glycosyltransferase [Alphaproteobacteria bacterium]|nr:glycosyltransferase [Alphaproteobacteria bacterium]